jgi:hypothetical protein
MIPTIYKCRKVLSVMRLEYELTKESTEIIE